MRKRHVPRWLRQRRRFVHATSTGRFWCRSDGQGLDAEHVEQCVSAREAHQA